MAILWVYYGYYILLTHNLVQCYTMVTKVSLVSKLKSAFSQEEGSVKYQQLMTDDQCSKDYYKLDKKL